MKLLLFGAGWWHLHFRPRAQRTICASVTHKHRCLLHPGWGQLCSYEPHKTQTSRTFSSKSNSYSASGRQVSKLQNISRQQTTWKTKDANRNLSYPYWVPVIEQEQKTGKPVTWEILCLVIWLAQTWVSWWTEELKMFGGPLSIMTPCQTVKKICLSYTQLSVLVQHCWGTCITLSFKAFQPYFWCISKNAEFEIVWTNSLSLSTVTMKNTRWSKLFSMKRDQTFNCKQPALKSTSDDRVIPNSGESSLSWNLKNIVCYHDLLCLHVCYLFWFHKFNQQSLKKDISE